MAGPVEMAGVSQKEPFVLTAEDFYIPPSSVFLLRAPYLVLYQHVYWHTITILIAPSLSNTHSSQTLGSASWLWLCLKLHGCITNPPPEAVVVLCLDLIQAEQEDSCALPLSNLL